MQDQLSALGFDVARTAELEQLGNHLVPARVTRVDRGAVTVATADDAELRLAAENLAVGDWIALDGSTVQARLERRSALVRNAGDATREAMAEEARVVAANVDVVIVVRALDMPVRPGRVQQLVALAYASGADVAFVLTKADCHDDVARAIYEIELVAPGVSVLAVSAVTGDGIDELVTLIGGRTFVLLGESGAGKSTLVNRLAGEELLATGEVQRSGAGPPHHDPPAAGGAGGRRRRDRHAGRAHRRLLGHGRRRVPGVRRRRGAGGRVPLLRLLARLRAGLRRPRRRPAGAPRGLRAHAARAAGARGPARPAPGQRAPQEVADAWSDPTAETAGGSVAQVRYTASRAASMLGPDG